MKNKKYGIWGHVMFGISILFAAIYWYVPIDLVPDTIGPAGLIDDIIATIVIIYLGNKHKSFLGKAADALKSWKKK